MPFIFEKIWQRNESHRLTQMNTDEHRWDKPNFFLKICVNLG